MKDRIWLEINTDKIVGNIKAIKSLQDKQICAVLKADAYGIGMISIAHAIQTHVEAFGVATINEGIKLRKCFPNKTIFLLGKAISSEWQDAIINQIVLTVDSLSEATAIQRVALKLNKIAFAQLAVDSGMARIGAKYCKDFFIIARSICRLSNIKIVGVFSHYADAENNEQLTLEQTSKFLKTKLGLECLGQNIQNYHICNSAAALSTKENFCNMARVGLAMYGICPMGDNKLKCKLQGAVSFWSQLIKVFYVEKGQGIGYGHTYVAGQNMRIGVVSCGYADGYPLALSNRGFVEIAGQRARVVGKICMDMFMVDISFLKNAQVGQKVLLWTSDSNAFAPITRVAKLAMSSEYELLCRVGERVKRVYVDNNSNLPQYKSYI